MRWFNLEQKFACSDGSIMIWRCRAKGYRYHSRGRQDDLYFASKRGRLKIRRAGPAAELIWYDRPDSRRPRASGYIRLPIEFGRKELAFILDNGLGTLGSVMKTRTVYYNERVRINIDRVEGLGDFVELEAEMRNGERKKAMRLLEETKAALGLANDRAIAESYIDQISKKGLARTGRHKAKGAPRTK